MYQLKTGQESFEVVDGEFAGRKYIKGKVYDKIPPNEKKKFKTVGGRVPEVGGQKKVEKKNSLKPQTSNLTPPKSKPEVTNEKLESNP